MTSNVTSAELAVHGAAAADASFSPVCTRIQRHAAAGPDRLAVADPDGQLTYAELTRRASDLAGTLRAAGAGPDSCVGLYLERSADFVVAACGVLWAGAAYLPIDPATPRDRVEYVLAD